MPFSDRKSQLGSGNQYTRRAGIVQNENNQSNSAICAKYEKSHMEAAQHVQMRIHFLREGDACGSRQQDVCGSRGTALRGHLKPEERGRGLVPLAAIPKTGIEIEHPVHRER